MKLNATIDIETLRKSLVLCLEKLNNNDRVMATGILLGAIWALDEEIKQSTKEKK